LRSCPRRTARVRCGLLAGITFRYTECRFSY
jgi:hypothetical protein